MRRIADRARRGIPWWAGLLLLSVPLVLPNVFAVDLPGVWLRFPGLDKPTHFLAFVAVFLVTYAVIRGWSWPRGERGKLGLAVCLCLFVSAADEFLQAVLALGRTAEYGDLVADAAGVCVGLTCVTAGRLGAARATAIVALLLVPVGAVTAMTHRDLKHFYRGMAYEREGDYQRARDHYLMALDGGFQSSELYNTIAWLDVEFLDDHAVEAQRYAARAFEMDPDNPDILDTYGWVLVRAGRAQEGLALLERAKTSDPDIYCIHLHLGIAYRELGDLGRAVEHLRRQIERNPADRFARSARVALDQLARSAE